MKKKNKISPSIEEMKGWFYVHSDVATFTSYMIADDPFGKNRDFNEACFIEAYTSLLNALSIIATSEVKNMLNEEAAVIKDDGIKDLIIRCKKELKNKTGFKTFKPELKNIRISDNFSDYNWLEHYKYEDYIKIRTPKNVNLKDWLDSKKAPFLSNWVLHLTITAYRNELDKQGDVNKNLQASQRDVELKNEFNRMDFEEVRKHFIQLTKKLNKSKKKWMTEHDFDVFLKRSFGGQKDLSKPKIEIGSGGKYAVVKLFHAFFSKSHSHSYEANTRKQPYIDLLKNAFDTEAFNNLQNNNFKIDKSKYEWDI